jgi:hypothetical protein
LGRRFSFLQTVLPEPPTTWIRIYYLDDPVKVLHGKRKD